MLPLRLIALISAAFVCALAAGSAQAAVGTTLDAGGSHSCALTAGGAVKCWGADYVGQLGDGAHADQKTPVGVSGLSSGVESVVNGDLHSCALTTLGGVKCWGYNDPGQLGDGTNSDSDTPVDVQGLTTGVASIAVGDYHGCAVTTVGAVKCWGSNGAGQLGDGTTGDSNVPVDVPSLSSGVAAITAGIYHTCALTIAGGVKCWGLNENGQLGVGDTADRSLPTGVSGLTSGVTAISAGRYHTCALLAGGGVKCWGANWSGKVGDATAGDKLLPTDVVGLGSGVFSITAGGDHTCALTTIGGVKCWGFNGSGQLGDGTTAMRIIPVDVSGLAIGVTEVAAGADHTCALLATGSVKCWGANAGGRLGDGAVTDKNVPTGVSGLEPGITDVLAAAHHSCALASGGVPLCWGSNWAGQLGDATVTARSTAAGISGLASGVSSLAGGAYHSCARTGVGAVKCWGHNGFGQLGDGSNLSKTTPANVSGMSSQITAVTAGNYHTCALNNTGGAKCWGHNAMGQLGDTTFVKSDTPVDVDGLTSGVSVLAAGGTHTCALTTGGAVKCWGFARFGQLGNGGNVNMNTPVDVTGLSPGVTAIAAGAYHSCALTSGGGVKCWGHNIMGQLGDGLTDNSNTPIDVSGLSSGVTAIAAGGYETCALLTGGAVKCWGYNGDGQLGDGTTVNKSTPTPVSGLASGVTEISVGDFDACAVLATGAVECWGNDGDGQLGDGATITRTPLDVFGLTDVMQPATVPPGFVPSIAPAPPPSRAVVSPRLVQIGKGKRRRGKLLVRLAAGFALPAGADLGTACTGKVRFAVKPKGSRRTVKAAASLTRSDTGCKARATLKLTLRSRKKKLTVRVSYPGNDSIAAFNVRRSIKIR